MIREMGPGEFFGEMALLEDKPRSARVSTVMPTTLLAVTRQGFNTLIEQTPDRGDQFSQGHQCPVAPAIPGAIHPSWKKNRHSSKRLPPKMRRGTGPDRTAGGPVNTVAEHERVKRDLEIAREIQRQMFRRYVSTCSGIALVRRLRCQPRGSGAICMMPYASRPTRWDCSSGTCRGKGYLRPCRWPGSWASFVPV